MTMNQFTKKILHVNSSVEKIEILKKEKEIHIHLKERRKAFTNVPTVEKVALVTIQFLFVENGDILILGNIKF